MQQVDLLLTNGKVVTPSGTVNAAIAVKDGKIAAIGDEAFMPPAHQRIDVGGRHVLPGVVDSEAHPGCYVPFERDVETETRAAAAAGVTTWGVHAPVTRLGKEPFKDFVDLEDVVSFHEVMPGCINIINRAATVDIFITPMMETDQHAAEVPEYAKEWGITSFKLYLQCKSPKLDKFWASRRAGLIHGLDDGMIWMTMENVAALGNPALVQIHAENWEIARVFEKRLIEAGRTDWAAWSDRSPGFLEAHHVRTYAYLAKQTGAPLYIQHVSCTETFEEIRRARAEGVNIYGQTGPAWLHFSREHGWRINVPLRPKETLPLIWGAMARGEIDAVGSDHVIAWDPNSRADLHNDSIWKLRTGFTSRVELMLPVLLTGVNSGLLSLQRAVEVACENPARIFGLYPKKGAIAVGSDADFVVVDLNRELTVSNDMVATRSGWTLLENETMKGWPVMTILRGEVIMEWPDGAPGPLIKDVRRGRYLRREVTGGRRPSVLRPQ